MSKWAFVLQYHLFVSLVHLPLIHCWCLTQWPYMIFHFCWIKWKSPLVHMTFYLLDCFQNVLSAIGPSVVEICNTSLLTGVVPRFCKYAVVEPILKNSSSNLTQLKNYRLISKLKLWLWSGFSHTSPIDLLTFVQISLCHIWRVEYRRVQFWDLFFCSCACYL